jgi:predicted MFS family arabinose efflux permease
MDKENKAPGFSTHQMVIIGLLALTQFSVILDFMVISPLGDALMKSLNITPKQFGLVVSCYAFAAAVSGLLTAGFADRFDRKKLLLFFYCGFIAGTLLCGLAPTYSFLVFGRIITGLFGGVIGSISLTIVADLFPLQMRGRAMGILQMGFAASQVLGIPAGLYFANILGWHLPFLMIVFLGAAITLLLLFFLEPVTGHLKGRVRQSITDRYITLLNNPDYRKGFMLTATVYIGGFLMQPFASTYFINNLGTSPHDLPLIFLCSGIASLIVMPLMGKLSDRIDKFRLFAAGSCWAIIMILIYTHLVPIPLWVLTLVNICLFVGVFSRNVPAGAIISAVPDSRDRGAFLSINSCLQQLSGGLAAALAGLIIKQPGRGAPIQHFPILGYVGIMVMLLSMFFMFRVSKTIKARLPAYNNA